MAHNLADSFVPECKADGSYAAVQCFEHQGFGRQCWCVDKDGEEIKGTRNSNGKTPDCGQPVSNVTTPTQSHSQAPSAQAADATSPGEKDTSLKCLGKPWGVEKGWGGGGEGEGEGEGGRGEGLGWGGGGDFWKIRSIIPDLVQTFLISQFLIIIICVWSTIQRFLVCSWAALCRILGRFVQSPIRLVQDGNSLYLRDLWTGKLHEP